MKMENDGHIESRLALQTMGFEHYCIAYKCCRHNFDIFMALDALPIQLIMLIAKGQLQAIHQAAAWSVLWSVATQLTQSTELSGFK